MVPSAAMRMGTSTVRSRPVAAATARISPTWSHSGGGGGGSCGGRKWLAALPPLPRSWRLTPAIRSPALEPPPLLIGSSPLKELRSGDGMSLRKLAPSAAGEAGRVELRKLRPPTPPPPVRVGAAVKPTPSDAHPSFSQDVCYYMMKKWLLCKSHRAKGRWE
jgi:hypothetical protein